MADAHTAAAGARVERNSGFPIEYTHAGTKYQGFLGYYGLALPAIAQQSGPVSARAD